MAVRKLTISLEPTVADDVARLADEEGTSVSAWLSDAARQKARRAAAREALAAYESEHGPLSEEQIEAGRRFWQE